jgi:protein tyrosine/serine phosphatase
MLANDGPYLVHCYAGVDRTGIVCAILAALMGASPEEIAADYARSFYNGAESSVYAGDVSAAGGAILRQLDAVFGVETHDGIVLASLAECYLKEKLRMIGAQIAALKARLAGKKMNELRKFFTGLSLYDKPPMIY